METRSDVTWEDVEAVCKLMGWKYTNDTDEYGDFTVWVTDEQFGVTFTRPKEVLEYITYEKF